MWYVCVWCGVYMHVPVSVCECVVYMVVCVSAVLGVLGPEEGVDQMTLLGSGWWKSQIPKPGNQMREDR